MQLLANNIETVYKSILLISGKIYVYNLYSNIDTTYKYLIYVYTGTFIS